MKPFSLFSSFLLVTVLTTCYSDAFTRNDFPEDFLFGAGTSAYQWEGAFDEDGKTPSVWDTTCHCSNGSSNGDIACDGYHKYKEDVKLMAEMGLESFRFSISWTRILPDGRGRINPEGVLFYKNLIKELKSHGIEPHATLYHYDLPQSLEDEYGGFTNRKIIEDFTTFADVCFKNFGEDVKLWTTINEATLFALGTTGEGIQYGHCTPTNSTVKSSTITYIAGHNMLLAHASVSRMYKLKYKSKQRGSVGLSIYACGLAPYTNSKADEIATQRAKAFLLGWMLKPLVFGDYPDEMKRTVGSRLPVFSKEESEQVKGSSDFIGIVHYNTFYVTNRNEQPLPSFFASLNKAFCTDMGTSFIYAGRTTSSYLDWEAIPWGLEGLLEYIKQGYNNPPIYILENGKIMKHDTMLEDTPRIEYIQGYIGAVLNAIKNGSDTRGYYVWSLIDLYELFGGYKKSFGLYYVNFSDPGLKRTPKLSASWYTGFLNGTVDVASQDITQLQSKFSGSSSL